MIINIIRAYYNSNVDIIILMTILKENFSVLNNRVSRGLPETIQYVKESRNLVLQYISGRRDLKSELVPVTNGFPTWLIKWIPLISSSDEEMRLIHIRILMTLLLVTRHLKLKKSIDISTIIEPSKGMIDSILSSEIKAAFNSLGVRINQNWPEWDSFHPTVKKGPAGPAIMCSVSELAFLPHNLLDNIISIGGKKLGSEILDNLDSLDVLKGQSVSKVWSDYIGHTKRNWIRKLSYFSDKEGKSRVIAILDYWSQTALYPLHNSLNRILRGIKTDCTFNQSDFLKILPTTEGITYHSIDLSAATDRMPIALQKRVLAILFNNSWKSTLWASILVDYPFHVILPDKSHIEIMYKAGQPMGAYSSWPAMALTHHIIVQIAAIRKGFINFKDYCILGDDLVIANDSVASMYKQIIANLDMPYSPAKTFTSKEIYEFAKRWIYHGQEVTGFSIGGYFKVWKKYSLLSAFIDNQAGHGWRINEEAIRGLVLSGEKLRYGSKFIIERTTRFINLFSVFSSIVSYKNNPTIETGQVLVNNITRIRAISPSWLDLLNKDPQQFLRELLIKAKMEQTKQDLAKYQKDLFSFNNKLNGVVTSFIKQAWGNQTPTSTESFIRETLSVLLNWNNPIVQVFNRLIDSSMEYLTESVFYDESIGPNYNLIINDSLGKYMITKSMFSMKQSESKTLAEAAVTKKVLDILGSEYTPLSFNLLEVESTPKYRSSGLNITYLRKLALRSYPTFIRYFDFLSGACICYIIMTFDISLADTIFVEVNDILPPKEAIPIPDNPSIWMSFMIIVIAGLLLTIFIFLPVPVDSVPDLIDLGSSASGSDFGDINDFFD